MEEQNAQPERYLWCCRGGVPCGWQSRMPPLATGSSDHEIPRTGSTIMRNASNMRDFSTGLEAYGRGCFLPLSSPLSVIVPTAPIPHSVSLPIPSSPSLLSLIQPSPSYLIVRSTHEGKVDRAAGVSHDQGDKHQSARSSLNPTVFRSITVSIQQHR